jgi:hypothetical protein
LLDRDKECWVFVKLSVVAGFCHLIIASNRILECGGVDACRLSQLVEGFSLVDSIRFFARSTRPLRKRIGELDAKVMEAPCVSGRQSSTVALANCRDHHIFYGGSMARL